MKKKRNMYITFLSVLAVVYIILVMILFWAESHGGNPTMKTLGDAFWYSVVTLSTVGYGDMLPVTWIGHFIGVIFLLLSTGIMVTLLGTIVSLFTSEAVPMMKLSFQKNKNWYYFADYSTESNTLAENIIKDDENAIIIYGERQDEQSELPDYPCVFLHTSLSSIVAKKRGKGSRCKVFLMKENDIGVNRHAHNIHELPVDVYARTTNGRDGLSGNIHFFHSYDCCARQYWHSKPLCKDEKVIVLLGFEHYGHSILERAIFTNILSAEQHVVYHIFGKPDDFLGLHYKLNKVFSINEISDTRDSLIFHDENWENCHDILESADRIIICKDDEPAGWNIFWKLGNYYKINGRIDLKCRRKAQGVSCFGCDEDIYTTDQILRTKLNDAAIHMNDIFRKSVSYKTLTWDELDDFHKQSKITAADHMLIKVRLLLRDESIVSLSPIILEEAYRTYNRRAKTSDIKEEYRRIDHLRWKRFYTYYNWSYGPVRDDAMRQHPMMSPYERLTEEQKIERDASWELLGSLAKEYGM